MRRRYAQLFGLARYTTPAERIRAQVIITLTLLLLGSVLPVLTLPSNFPWEPEAVRSITLGQRMLQVWRFPLSGGVLWVYLLLGVLALWGVRRGAVNWAGLAPSLMLFMAGVPFAIIGGLNTAGAILIVVSFMVVTALAARLRGLVLAMPLLAVTLIVGFQLNPPDPPLDAALVVFMLVTILAELIIFITVTRAERLEDQLVDTEQRARLAALTTHITQSAARHVAPQDLLQDAVERLLVALPTMYHAQVFLLEPNMGVARLVASTGDVGRELLARNHQLAIASLSVIGQVSARSDSVDAVVGQPGSMHRVNPLLPDTAYEAAFPMRLQAQVLGVLDVQSRLPQPLRPDQRQALQEVADTLAAAYSSTLLYQTLQEQQRTNERLNDAVRQAQGTIERLAREAQGRTWANYLRERAPQVNVDVDLAADDGQPVHAADGWTPQMRRAAEANQVVLGDASAEGRVVAVPLRAGGQVIGVMEFEVGADGHIAPDDLLMLNEVGDRFGLAAEGSRINRERQRIAQREALTNEIGTRIQTGSSIEAVLLEAARGLRDGLQARRVAVRLGKPNAATGGAPKARNGQAPLTPAAQPTPQGDHNTEEALP